MCSESERQVSGMNIRIRLLLLREIERRNDDRIKGFRKPRKDTLQPRSKKANYNMDKPKKPK